MLTAGEMWTEYCNCGDWFVFQKLTMQTKRKKAYLSYCLTLLACIIDSYRYLTEKMRFFHCRIKANSLHSHKQQGHCMMKKTP